MTRIHLDEQLDQLSTSLVEMGAMIEEALEKATTAVFTRDFGLSEKVSEGDYRIDKKEKEIEGMSMKLLTLQQPVAHDLRQISATLKIVTDMERIGDHAADISDINGWLAEHEIVPDYDFLRKMSEASSAMVKEAIDSYVKNDAELAKKVIKDDAVVDKLYRSFRKRLISLILENPEFGDQAFDLMQIAKYYERIADHATNISKWVIYAVTGKYPKAKAKKKTS